VSDAQHRRVEAEGRAVATVADRDEGSSAVLQYRPALLAVMWMVAGSLFLFGGPGAAAGTGPGDQIQAASARLCQERLTTSFETRYSSTAGTDIVSAIDVRGLETAPGRTCAALDYDVVLQGRGGVELARFRGQTPQVGDAFLVRTDRQAVRASDVATVRIVIRG
jgi:hypothetical protein